METVPAGQVPADEVYEKPMIVEAGQFTEMTQGNGHGDPDLFNEIFQG
jgi:hypothetical protein